MKLLNMGRQQQCMLFSLAMVLDESPETLVQEIGHNGMELWWPGFPEPHCCRGYHIQELIDVCLDHGASLVPIELYPRSASAMSPSRGRVIWDPSFCEDRFARRLENRRAILITATHACAWDGSMVFDPNGRIVELSRVPVREAWILV